MASGPFFRHDSEAASPDDVDINVVYLSLGHYISGNTISNVLLKALPTYAYHLTGSMLFFIGHACSILSGIPMTPP